MVWSDSRVPPKILDGCNIDRVDPNLIAGSTSSVHLHHVHHLLPCCDYENIVIVSCLNILFH